MFKSFNKFLRQITSIIEITLYIFIVFGLPSIIFAESTQPSFNDSLKIIDSQINHSKGDNCSHISCIGKVKNDSNETWEEPVFEVQFFNSKNELIDTFTEYKYDMVIQPYDEIAFRIRNTADKDFEEYQSYKVRITSANPRIEYKPKKPKKNTLTEIIISWTPMVLLIVVWLFFMRKYLGKNSPQKKIIEIQENQCTLIEHQNQLFEKMVDAIKDLKKTDN